MRKWRRSDPTTVAVLEIRLCLAADGAETLVIFTGLDLLVCLHDGLGVGNSGKMGVSIDGKSISFSLSYGKRLMRVWTLIL